MKHPLYRCSSCERSFRKSMIVRSWQTASGAWWHTCRTCQRALDGARELDAFARAAAERDA